MEHFARGGAVTAKAVLAAAVLLPIPSVFGAAGTISIRYPHLSAAGVGFHGGRRDIWRTISTWLHLHDHRGEYVHRVDTLALKEVSWRLLRV